MEIFIDAVFLTTRRQTSLAENSVPIALKGYQCFYCTKLYYNGPLYACRILYFPLEGTNAIGKSWLKVPGSEPIWLLCLWSGTYTLGDPLDIEWAIYKVPGFHGIHSQLVHIFHVFIQLYRVAFCANPAAKPH